MEFIINNWPLIVAAAAVLAVCIYAILHYFKLPTKAQLEKVREWLLYSTILAEKELGGGTGKLKLRMVYDMFLAKFPWLAKVLSFAKFSGLVDDALEQTKTMLTNNAAVQLYVNGPSDSGSNSDAEG